MTDKKTSVSAIALDWYLFFIFLLLINLTFDLGLGDILIPCNVSSYQIYRTAAIAKALFRSPSIHTRLNPSAGWSSRNDVWSGDVPGMIYGDYRSGNEQPSQEPLCSIFFFFSLQNWQWPSIRIVKHLFFFLHYTEVGQVPSTPEKHV